jgi:hypothetical protein
MCRDSAHLHLLYPKKRGTAIPVRKGFLCPDAEILTREEAEEHMDKQYDPLSEPEKEETPQDREEEPVLISTDDFYDLLMEQQEQM